jgi:RNA polymerase sigma-70 factor (ECF subfamily)
MSVKDQMRYLQQLSEGVSLDSTNPLTSEMHSAVSQYLPSLHRYACRLLGNETDAEDAVQDALLAAFQHLNQFRGEAQLSTWLTAIVINCARMQMRKRSRYIQVSLDSRIGEAREYALSDTLMDHRPNPEDECHRSTLSARLMKSALQLSPILRKTFYLRFVYQLSICETARVLGVPTGTVKAQTARAKAKLQKLVRGVLHRGSSSRRHRF